MQHVKIGRGQCFDAVGQRFEIVEHADTPCAEGPGDLRCGDVPGDVCQPGGVTDDRARNADRGSVDGDGADGTCEFAENLTDTLIRVRRVAVSGTDA